MLTRKDLQKISESLSNSLQELDARKLLRRQTKVPPARSWIEATFHKRECIKFIQNPKDEFSGLTMTANIRKIRNDTEINRILNRDFTSIVRTGYVEVGDDNMCLPIYYQDFEEKIRNLEVRDDDVFIIAHPKTGTTWTAEMVWLIVNNFDYQGAKEILYNRFIQFEYPILFNLRKYYDATNELDRIGFDPFDYLDNFKGTRCIKSHLHWSLLPEQLRNFSKQPKIISLLRSAEDVCISLYHHCRLSDGYKGTFEDFCELFLAGKVPFGPFWKQVLSCWQHKDKPNFLFIKFTELKENLPSVIRKVATFLERPITDEQVDKLADHLSFNSMKNNPAVNYDEDIKKLQQTDIFVAGDSFIRSGKVGTYKSIMSPEMIERFRLWTKANLAGTDLCVE